MASLLDIAPLTEEVAGVTVYGVSAQGIAYLIDRFDEVRALMAGRELTLTVADITRLAPEAIAAIIAAGVGQPGNPEHEKAAALIPVHLQVDFLSAIVRLTAPNGLAALRAKIEALGGMFDHSTTAPASRSPKPSKP